MVMKIKTKATTVHAEESGLAVITAVIAVTVLGVVSLLKNEQTWICVDVKEKEVSIEAIMSERQNVPSEVHKCP